MKIRNLLPFALLLVSSFALHAQDKKPLTLDEAINMAVTNSNEASLADTKVATKELDLANTKNNIYPEFKISGQYMRLTSPTVKLKLPTGNDNGNDNSNDGSEDDSNTSMPEVNQIMFGQASLSMPVFSGGRLRYNVEASRNLYEAETYTAADTKEQVAMQTVMLYVNLYKAQQSVDLIKENLKSANQRVTDFTNMEQNGLLARNDLLKAQLQSSNTELSLEDAQKNVAVINYQLVTLLKLPEGTQIVPDDSYFKSPEGITPAVTANDALAQRNDLEALRRQQKAAEAGINIAKADYYPSLSLSAGYVALDIQHVVQVYNAVNFGAGISYDISGIFKNGKKVKAARSRAEEANKAVEILSDRIKVQVNQALENYNLALKQYAVYTDAVAQATENYRIVKDKYDNGLQDTNDLLEADVQQLQAKLNEAFAKADITQRYYELLKAAGKLTNSFNLTPNN